MSSFKIVFSSVFNVRSNSPTRKEVKEIKLLVKFPMGHSSCNVNVKPANGDNSKTDFYDYSLFAIISKSSE